MLTVTDIINYKDLRDTYRTFHPKTKEYTFISVQHETTLKMIKFLETKQFSTDKEKLKLLIASDQTLLNKLRYKQQQNLTKS